MRDRWFRPAADLAGVDSRSPELRPRRSDPVERSRGGVATVRLVLRSILLVDYRISDDFSVPRRFTHGFVLIRR